MSTNLYRFNSGNYRDRYTSDSQWVKLLFNHDRPLQTAELIEMQSIMQTFLKKGMDTLFANGSILNGLKFSQFISNTLETEFTMSSGRFYVDGIVLDVPAKTISVSNQGEFNIGLKVVPSVITEEEDPNLRDPIKGGAVYGLPGAARLVWNTELVIDDPSSFTLAKVLNGGLIQKETNIFSKIDDSLAKYTFARTGNFCLPGGLETTVIDSQERAVADVSKYEALSQSATVSSNNTQQAYSDLLSSKAALENLQSQVKQASSTYNTNPTNSNLITLQDLNLRLTNADNKFNEFSRLYSSRKIISDKAEANLASAKSLLADKVYLSVSPGVGYVEGYRVDITTPVILEVPKNLETSQVDGAIFTYSGTQASTIRNFSLEETALWSDVVDQNTLLTINFTKLLYNQQFVSISLNLSLTLDSFNSVDSLLEFLFIQLNKGKDEPYDHIIITSSDLVASKEVLRTILKNNLVIQKVGSSLVFTSTTLNEVANQVTVDIEITQTFIEEFEDEDPDFIPDPDAIIDDVITIAPSEVLLVDVNSSNLAGAGRFNSFQLGFRPVADILSLTAELEENQKPIVRGPIPGTSDKLGDDSIFKITKVSQGDLVYVEGVDYQLINQSEIDWSLATEFSTEPEQGTTYYVSFLYTQPLAKDIDFTLNNKNDSIEFLNKTPAPNQRFYVNYSYYLAKAGTVSLDKSGGINYVLSSSSINPIPPALSDNQLTIATFKLYADKTNITVSDCKIITLTDLQGIVSQVKKTTCELESQRLDNTALLKANNNEVTPKGYFNSTLQDLTTLNLKNTLFNGAISPSVQSLTGGYLHKDVLVTYSEGGNLFTNEVGLNYFVTLPYVSKLLLSQARLTKSRKVNTPANLIKRARMYVSPQLSFVNKPFSKFTAQDPLSSITTTLTRLSDNKPLVLQAISSGVQTLLRGFGDKLYKSFIEGTPLGNFIQDQSSFLGYMSNSVKAGSITVTIKVEHLPANSDGYRVYLAGKEVTNYVLLELTPLSFAYPGTIRAKADGTISFQFTLPEDFNYGSHPIELISDIDSGYSKSQIGIYNNLFTEIVFSALENWGFNFSKPVASNFILRSKPSSYDLPAFQASSSLVNPGSIPSVSLTVNSLEQKFPFLFDSVSQTFQLFDYYYITEARIKLKSIALNSELIMNLGESDKLNASPNRSYIASAYSELYSPSTDGTSWTTFNFTYPVLIQPNKFYSISLFSKQEGYEVYTAEITGTDLLTGGLVGDQLYLEGELFYSKDGKALDRLEREDLTYEVYNADFNIAEEVIVSLGTYGTINNLSSVTSFSLNSRDIIPTDTFIQYQYSLGGEWINFDSNKVISLSNPTSSFNIRAKLSSLRPNVSPALILEGSSVSLYSGLPSSTIVSSQTVYDLPYTDVYINIQYLIPSQTNIRVFYSPTDGVATQGQEWFELIKDESSERFVDQGLQIKEAMWRYTEESTTLPNGEARTKFRYRIDFSTSNSAIQANVLNIITFVN